MLTITAEQNVQTIITTYEVTPGTFLDLIDELRDAFERFVRRQPGFVSGAIHGNDAQTRVANYTQWESREHFKAVLRTSEMREYTRRFSELSRSFEPVLYDVAVVVSSDP